MRRFGGLEMAAAVAITRRDALADELRRAASRVHDGAVVRRLLALAMVMEGASRQEAAEACGMDRQTLRDWVHRYNEGGIPALSDQPHRGRPPRLSAGRWRN
jgi:transposase-like protein